MNFVEIINKKKNKMELSKDEIKYFIDNITVLPSYQISALLMAIVLNGMTDEETICLTSYMANSGEKIKYNFETVDKHSTGGVGDKVSLIVAPIASSLGCKVAKMSGRGLGYTGGTIDKLESIPGFKTDLIEEQFITQIKEINVAIISQTKNIAPADKILYALRDVTATVESIPLIAASIMSKKIATGSKNLVVDVKVGNGAFMKNLSEAKELSKMIEKIGMGCSINTKTVITNMDIPLGKNIGNQLEIFEAYEVLNGGGDENLIKVSLNIAANMVSLYKKISYDEAFGLVTEAIKSKKAVNKFFEFIKYQGGNLESITPPKYKKDIYALDTGYIDFDALKIGKTSMLLGAGRLKKEDEIDPKAGVVLHRKINELVKKGEIIASLYSNSPITIDLEGVTYNEELKEYKMIYDEV